MKLAYIVSAGNRYDALKIVTVTNNADKARAAALKALEPREETREDDDGVVEKYMTSLSIAQVATWDVETGVKTSAELRLWIYKLEEGIITDADTLTTPAMVQPGLNL